MSDPLAPDCCWQLNSLGFIFKTGMWSNITTPYPYMHCVSGNADIEHPGLAVARWLHS